MKSRTFAPIPEDKSQESTSPKPKRQSVLDRISKKMPLRPMPAYSEDEEQYEKSVSAFEIDDHSVDLVLLDARLIEQNSHPPRQIHTEEAIKELADSIRKDGQRDAIHVIPHPEKPGRYIIGDGWTRVQAICAYDINNTTVLTRIHQEMSEEEVAWLGYAQNEERKQHTDYDRAVFFSGWMKSGMQGKEIAERTGISPTLLSFYAAFNKLPPEALVLVKNNTDKVSATAAHLLYRILELSDEAHLMRTLHAFIEQDKPRTWLKDVLEKLPNQSKAATTTRQPQPRKTMFRKDFANNGVYKQRSDGRIELTLTVEADKIEQFNSGLLEFLTGYTSE